jgi:xylulokinase
MLLLGIDIGTSSIKVSVLDASSQVCLSSAQYPDTEVDIIAPQPDWAEQSPELWWEHVQQAILKCNATRLYDPADIKAIGISYQMHGLVLVDKHQQVLRNSIIWCDGRAVANGNAAFEDLGKKYCLTHLLNSPGNFTASKLAWVKENEPQIYERIDKMMLPGDFISMKLTGEITTTVSALSEGIFWDFAKGSVSRELMNYYGLDFLFIPAVRPLFSTHGYVRKDVAGALSLTAGIPVTYKAGDQLNNAFSLQVTEPGEVAATAGTSGVIYGVSDALTYDEQSRINSFAHVNYSTEKCRVGVLLCINGAGIFNRWIRNMVGRQYSYETLNKAAADVIPGADGLFMLPFGNGPERMLNNRTIGAHVHHLNLNTHGAAHVYRAGQEAVAFAFRYGLDIMRENGMHPGIIKAGSANMFLSDVFIQAFVNATGVPVELYDTDGSCGAARGAGVALKGSAESSALKAVRIIEPSKSSVYEDLYGSWKNILETYLNNPVKVGSAISA